MKNILFDASSHLGQFCISDEAIRKGCKNMQASISPVGADDLIGGWTDLENGRADRTVWNLPDDVQDCYYPVMDRFYSITNVCQPPLTEKEELLAMKLAEAFPLVDLYSRYTCARAITQKATEIHTLNAELLSTDVIEFMQSAHGIKMILPRAEVEMGYSDPVLEQRYQTALQAFRHAALNAPEIITDDRERILRLS